MFTFSFAQNPTKTTLKGILTDSTGAELAFGTVMLLEPKDSALINFTRSDEKAGFEFKNIKNRDYLLKISYVGYLPYQSFVAASAKDINDFGKIILKPISKELMEVVIKTARAPLSIKGDTIEYNAASFKVPPGSTVEDLLRRLPGIDIDADGNIKAQGKSVKRLYVDGKTFFGDDPKSATKNLDAETISKVQVFNEKSDQSKLTGVDDGKKEKAMNLELKEQFKKGAFGKVAAAAGTEDRWATRGNYNRFDKKQQFSVLGYANNVNQTGVNWEDYGEFKGQNTFNNNDNGDFGFSSGGGFIRYYGNENSDVPFNYFDGRGFTNNSGAGANYNFDNKKTKISTSYFYNQTLLNLDQYGFKKTFLQDSTFSNTDTLHQSDFRRNHSIGLRLEQMIDSNNTLITKLNFRHSDDDKKTNDGQTFSSNLLQSDKNETATTDRINTVAIYRHKFKTKGKSFAASATYNYSVNDANQNWRTRNTFFSTSTDNIINQTNLNQNNTSQLRSSAIYTSPISKKFFGEVFYNFSTTSNQYNRQVSNPEKSYQRVDSLSNYYDNSVLYNRLGSSVRYNFEGVNVSVGTAFQRLNLKSAYATDKNLVISAPFNIDKHYDNITPNVSIDLELKNNKYFSLGYSYNVSEPDVKKLQPVTVISNQLYRTIGNADLSPETSNSFNLSFNMFNPANFSYGGVDVNFDLYDNRNVDNLTIENIPNLGISTTSRPENYAGGFKFSGNSWFGFPIVKTKLTFNGNINYNWTKNPSLVNNVLNETTNNQFTFKGTFVLTLGTKLILEAAEGFTQTKINYSITDGQNQNIFNNTATASVKWNFIKGFYFESNFNYRTYTNDRYGFNQTVPIWNASVRKLMLKDNRLELRLSAFDIFNKNVNIQQFGSANYYSSTFAPTLSRYFLLGFTYNLRGHDDKLKKDGGMMIMF